MQLFTDMSPALVGGHFRLIKTFWRLLKLLASQLMSFQGRKSLPPFPPTSSKLSKHSNASRQRIAP